MAEDPGFIAQLRTGINSSDPDSWLSGGSVLQARWCLGEPRTAAPAEAVAIRDGEKGPFAYFHDHCWRTVGSGSMPLPFVCERKS